jgi:hypothetical protein
MTPWGNLSQNSYKEVLLFVVQLEHGGASWNLTEGKLSPVD